MSLEPLYEYVVEIQTGLDEDGQESVLPVLTCARSEYEATEKVHTKMMHMYPDRSKYKFGIKKLVYKPNPVHLN
jgi:hypothetical protein